MNPESVWHLINKDILKYIWFYVIEGYKSHIVNDTLSCLRVTTVKGWPKPTDICINMMPFIIGKEDSIPKKYRGYWPLIERCPVDLEERSKVGYLTIHESFVQPGKTQRRPGIHTETPGLLKRGGEVTTTSESCNSWGGGYYRRNQCHGGIYMASNVSDSCAVWDVKISNPSEIVGPNGDITHLRSFLGPCTFMKKDEIWWITDCTPHESLSLNLSTGKYRQYFRVVTSDVSVWYSEHSTPNELGIQPNAVIITGNKFET